MPRPAEFEEKEYEHLLVAAIGRKTNAWWGPGQVLERWLGFDVVLFGTAGIWQALGYLEPVGRGVYLRDLLSVPPRITRVPPSRLPTFRVNLFLQAKRPELMLRTRLELRAEGIDPECFRIKIDGRQQRRLVSMTGKLRGAGLVAYIAPAFYKSDDLNAARLTGNIFELSNSVSALRMRGHNYWLFNGPGQQGVGHSEPERVEEPSLESRLEELALRFLPEDTNELEILKNLRGLAEATIGPHEENDKPTIWSNLLKKQGNLARGKDISMTEEIIFLATIINDFCAAHRMVWAVYA